LPGTFSARGTPSSQNSSYLNGINVGDPAAIGAAGFYYDYDAFEDIQVSTGAHDITVPTGGVFLNMVTKSGGENWRGRGTFAWLGDATQTQNIDDELLRYGFRPETNSVDFVSDVNLSGGGPIIARKLRGFFSFRDWRVHVNTPAAFSTLVLDSTDITSGLANLHYQLSDNNRLQGVYSRQYYKKPHRFLQASNTLEEASTSNEDDVFDIYQVLWNSVVTQRFFLDARVGLNRIFFPTYLNGNDQTLNDTATGIRTRNFTAGTERWRDRYQINTTGNYYLDEALGGRHEFKFGFDYSHMPVENRVTRFDDVDLSYNSATNTSTSVTLFGTPFYSKSALDVLAIYAQDAADSHVWSALREPERLFTRTEQPAEPFLPGAAALLPGDSRRRQLEHHGTASRGGIRPSRQRANRPEDCRGPLLLRDRRRRRYPRRLQSERQLLPAVPVERRQR
jgi:hypothetical protein